MSFMKDQAPRIIRERWADTNELAEELFAIFMSDKPIAIDSPIVMTNPGGGPAITINQGDLDNSTAIQIVNNPVPGPDITNVIREGNTITNRTMVTINNDGSITIYNIVPDPGPFPEPPIDGDDGGGGDAGGSVFPGKVLSGSGSSYQVAVYESGLNLAPVTRTVTQLQIDEDESIPEGTWAMVGKINGAYFMQVPVWL